ncbi:MAG: hypothetical protein ACI9KE_003025 [Polyangiales bacterium]|jgi:hypothetical protein
MRAFTLLLVVAGCAAPTESMTLDFPSRDTFVRSENAEVYVIPVAPDDLNACPRLLADAEVSALDAMSTGSFSVCDFQEGAVSYSDAPEGAVAYVAVARSATGQVLLSGCVVRNVYVDDPELVLVLVPTSIYRSEFRDAPPETCTAAAKCGGGCR